MQKKPFVPPVFLVNTAMRLRRAFLRAADAVVPPYASLMDHFFGAATTVCLQQAARLRIADHLEDGPRSPEELAKLTGVRAAELDRMLQVLDIVGVFRRDAKGRYHNNHKSKGLITGRDGGIRGFVDFFGQEELVRAWLELPRTLKEGGNGFTRLHGRHVWEWMSASPDGLKAFVEGMSSMTEVVAPAIAQAYPFEEIRRVCDVGGGVGIVLATALNHHAHLEGMLFDSASMLGEAKTFLEERGVAHRVELHAGSFFDAIPRGADAYLIKTVLHNWPDEDALKILRNVRAAMSPGHKLIVPDFLVEPDHISPLVPYMDIAGMMIYGGRERSVADLSKMFSATGFKLGRVIEIPGRQAVYEGVAVAS